MLTKVNPPSYSPERIPLIFSYNRKDVGEFFLKTNEDRIEIWNLSIYEKFRGNKLGYVLVKEMVEYIRTNFSSYKKMWLLVNPRNTPAVKIYSAAGFKIQLEDISYNNDIMILDI